MITAAADLDPAADPRRSPPGSRSGSAPALLAEVDRQCAAARAVLARGGPVYGVNTGHGRPVRGPPHRAGAARPPAQPDAGPGHRRPAVAGRAPRRRAIIAVRLRTFLSGDSGVSGAAVPAAGRTCSTRTSSRPYPGAARVARARSSRWPTAFGPADRHRPGAGAGRHADPPQDLAASPPAPPCPRTRRCGASGLDAFALGPKEGIALLAGVPGATALSLLPLAEAQALAAGDGERRAALSIAAAGASRDPYLAGLRPGRRDAGAACSARLRAAVGRSRPSRGRCRRRCRSGSRARSWPRCCGRPRRWPPRPAGRWPG